MLNEDIIIGIDLGTSNSVVSIYKDDKVIVVPNENGSYLTRSRVLITEEGLIVSDQEQYQEQDQKSIEILEIKRLMGLSKLSEITDKSYIFYKITEDLNNNCLLIEDKYKPEDISAAILKYMKKIAEDYLNKKILKAIVTVPAYFNDAQRSATKRACILANLEPIRLLNEPTAASLAYGILNNDNEIKKILVFDLGGGTFDISILSLDSDLFQVLTTSGSTKLGGSNFDNELFSYCLKQINQDLINFKEFNIDISDISSRSLKKLKKECISAKIALSSSLRIVITIEEFFKNTDLSITITRALFEQLCLKYFKECIKLMADALKETKLNKKDISEIVLVGGSTRIPKIKELIKSFFYNEFDNSSSNSNIIINDTIDPDQAVAYGAAIQGALLNKKLESKLLMDIVPMNLGLELSDGIFSIIIKKNTQIPVSVSKLFTTDKNSQKGLSIKVYEGLRVLAIDNHKLGQYDLDLSYNNKDAGLPIIEITFMVDASGILNIEAVDLDPEHRSNKISVSIQNLNKIDQAKLKDLQEDFKENAYYDSLVIINKKAQDKLICYCQELLKEFKDNLEISLKIKEILDWALVENNKDHNEYEKKQADVYYLIMDL